MLIVYLIFYYNFFRVPIIIYKCYFPPYRDPEVLEAAARDLQSHRESLLEQSQILQEENHSLREENSMNLSALQDLRNENASIVQSYNKASVLYKRLREKYSQCAAANQTLIQDHINHVARFQSALNDIVRQKAVNENLARLVQETTR